MAGVPQQRHPAITPIRQWITFEDRPFVTIRACLQYAANVRMEALVRGAQFFDVAFGGPGFRRKPEPPVQARWLTK